MAKRYRVQLFAVTCVMAGAILAIVYPRITGEEHGRAVQPAPAEQQGAAHLGEGAPGLSGRGLGATRESADRGRPETPPGRASGRPGQSRGAREDPAPDAPGFGSAVTLPGDPESSEGSELPEASGSLLFTLEDESGGLLPGIRVSLRSERASDEAETGDRGQVLFTDLPPGSYSYVVDAPDGRTLKSAAPIELHEAEERVVTLRLGEGDLSISGRVLNQDGEPVPGLTLFVGPYLLTQTAERLVSPNPREARTREDGSYVIRSLEPGEYEVRTAQTERYPSARVIVPAGAASADLVLVEGPEVRVYGTVTNTRGEPLEGVRVVLVVAPVEQTRTDGEGNYEIHVVAEERRSYDLSFTHGGYQAARPRLMGGDLARVRERRLDIQLEPVLDRIVVAGTVRTARGDPVVGEKIHLSSSLLKTGYIAVSDADGDFRIAGVVIGYDYQLWIQPTGRYKDYRQRSLALDRDDLFFEIVLETLPSGRLTGRIVDGEGGPLAGFRLWLWSESALGGLIPVLTDASGNFLVEEAPAGPVRFGTRSSPNLQVTGINLSGEGEQSVLLILDWGAYVVSGRVRDGGGSPVAGAQVQLSWWHEEGGARSTSNRQTLTDEGGLFRFAQVGPGSHQLNVTASGYQSVRQRLQVGMDSPLVEVWLEALAP